MFDGVMVMVMVIVMEILTVCNWNHFREKGPNVYIIKFPLHAVEM